MKFGIHMIFVVVLRIAIPTHADDFQKTNKNLEHNENEIKAIIEKENVHQLQAFIEKGLDINFKINENKQPLLSYAIKNKKSKITHFLIKSNADVNATDIKGHSPLMEAIYLNDYSLVRVLLEHGSNPNHMNSDKYAGAISSASWNGNLKIVKLLEKAGAELEIKNKYGETPIMCAADFGHLELIKYYISKGVNLNYRNNSGQSVLTKALTEYHDKHPENVRYLIDQGCELNCDDFVYLCSYEDLGDLVRKAIIDHPEFVNCINNDGVSPIIVAGTAEITEMLIKSGADVNVTDGYDDSALKYPIYNINYDQIKLLLENGINVNQGADSGYSALNLLINVYLDLVITNNKISYKESILNILRLLLEYRANPELLDNFGESPLSISKERDLKEIVEIMDQKCKKMESSN